jgi:hypothetical protein
MQKIVARFVFLSLLFLLPFFMMAQTQADSIDLTRVEMNDGNENASSYFYWNR